MKHFKALFLIVVYSNKYFKLVLDKVFKERIVIVILTIYVQFI